MKRIHRRFDNINSELYQAVVEEAHEMGIVPPQLALAIVSVESGWDPFKIDFLSQLTFAHKPEKYAGINAITPKTELIAQNIRWGLFQVAGWEARQMGFKLPLPQLCGHFNNAELGIRKLRDLWIAHEGNAAYVISAYRVGKVVLKPDGSFGNSAYVNQVLMVYDELMEP